MTAAVHAKSSVRGVNYMFTPKTASRRQMIRDATAEILADARLRRWWSEFLHLSVIEYAPMPSIDQPWSDTCLELLMLH